MLPRFTLAVLAAFGCLTGKVRAEGPLWLETEHFDELGGWTNDAQFLDQMGSPYLIAVGLGVPVADAVTTVTPPRAGPYRVWARTRDWAPEHHPGRFQIVLGGRVIDHVFGASGRSGWQWEDAGVHDLLGPTELRLRDQTGYYSRCDALVLAADPTWTPPADRESLAALRAELGGVSRRIEFDERYDVVVVGGGLAGCMAAVSSARMGANTALIQNRPVLGGNASVEILVPPVGVWPYGKQDPLDPRETGLVEEIRGKGIQTTEEAKPYSGRLLRLVESEPNLDLHLNTHATGVEKSSDSQIGAVLAVDVHTGRRMRFAGQVFVDCTGDGAIGVAAGAEHRHGRESRATHDEPMAPETGDAQTMGNTLMYASLPTGSPAPFEAPPWAMQFSTCDGFTPGRHPRLSRDIAWGWKIELGGTRNTYDDAEEIRDDLLRLVFGLWDHVKNHCALHREKAADHELAWVAHVAGKRESRRLLGDTVLTQHDIANQTLFADRVAYGGWGVDDHYPQGFFHDGPPAQHDYKGLLHSIPYRSLYSKNIDNLLMAGRNISASHVALSATRVMLTCAVIGQASGTAAGMCAKRNTFPRGIHEQHIESLQQQLLKDGAHLIDLPNADPRDLAPRATASASSERGEMPAESVINGYARAAGGRGNAWGPEADDRLPWVMLAWEQPQAFNVVHVSFLTKQHAARRFAAQVWRDDAWHSVAEVRLEPGSAGVRRHVLGFEPTTSAKLRVVLFERPVDVGLAEIRVYQEPEPVVETARRVARNRNLPDTGPGLPWDENVVWVTGVDPKKLVGIVIDDSQAERVGQWVRSDYTPPFLVDGYLHDGNTEKGQKSLRFTPNVPAAGSYELRLAYSAYTNRATNTPVTIRTPHETRTVEINQQTKPPLDGLFYPLGTFRLEAGSTTTVEITNHNTNGYVTVDGLQLLPKADS